MTESEDKALVPHFIIPLGVVLAKAEKEKGEPLTEEEVLKYAAEAPTIMLAKEDKAKIKVDFPDVNPADAWVDWHRVRPQYTGGIAPACALSIPCKNDVLPKIKATLTAHNFAFEAEPAPPGMAETYRQSASLMEPPLTEEDFLKIDAKDVNVFAYSKAYIADDAIDKSVGFLQLISQLIDDGAIAVHCDSAFRMHSNAAWKHLAEESQSPDLDTKIVALCRAFMQVPVEEGSDYMTCGLQMLGSPDVIVDKDVIQSTFPNAEQLSSEAMGILSVFAVYLLTECREGQFLNRQTFSTAEDAPYFRATWEPCTFPTGSPVYNPFGRRRLERVRVV